MSVTSNEGHRSLRDPRHLTPNPNPNHQRRASLLTPMPIPHDHGSQRPQSMDPRPAMTRTMTLTLGLTMTLTIGFPSLDPCPNLCVLDVSLNDNLGSAFAPSRLEH